jgi:hypothetical protein
VPRPMKPLVGLAIAASCSRRVETVLSTLSRGPVPGMPYRGRGSGAAEPGWIGLDRAGSSWIGLDRAGSGWIGLDRAGLGSAAGGAVSPSARPAGPSVNAGMGQSLPLGSSTTTARTRTSSWTGWAASWSAPAPPAMASSSAPARRSAGGPGREAGATPADRLARGVTAGAGRAVTGWGVAASVGDAVTSWGVAASVGDAVTSWGRRRCRSSSLASGLKSRSGAVVGSVGRQRGPRTVGCRSGRRRASVWLVAGPKLSTLRGSCLPDRKGLK